MYSEINIAEIADYLRDKKNNKQSIVLFLGSRTSGLFHNEILYERLKFYSLRNFDGLSNIEKFQECYRILSRRFNENEIYDILTSSLVAINYREGDKYLAKLIKEKYFDIIISTNIDAFLEDALFHPHDSQSNDYRVIIPPVDDIVFHGKRKYTLIVKIFGDLDRRSYKTASDTFDLNADVSLKRELEIQLERDVLVIGHDPVWDGSVERAFLLQGGNICYVNEEGPPPGAYFTQALHSREGRYCIGDHGSYESFTKSLHRYLVEGNLYSYRLALPPSLSTEQPKITVIHNANNESAANWGNAPLRPTAKPAITFDAHTVKNSQGKQEKRKVFISYSHKDNKYLEGLRTHLEVYEQIGRIDAWSDEKIKTGENWQEKIREALEAADAVVLLISDHFLVSKFIREVELPNILSAAKANKVVILPVILSPCLIEETPLSMFQAVNDPKKPLNMMRVPERGKIWMKVAKDIINRSKF